jgi:hypothetical protein
MSELYFTAVILSSDCISELQGGASETKCTQTLFLESPWLHKYRGTVHTEYSGVVLQRTWELLGWRDSP